MKLHFDKSLGQAFVCTAKKRRRSQTVFAEQKCFDHENRRVVGQSPTVLIVLKNVLTLQSL